MSIRCSLCKSSNVILTEKIKTRNLIDLYNKMLKLDISSEFTCINEIDFYHCMSSDLRFFYPMITPSEKIYDRLRQFDWYYMDDKYEYDYAANFIKQTDKVLEIGAGKGAFAKKIVCKEYVGIEFNVPSKIILEAEREGISIINELVQDHSKKNIERYDVVCSFQVLEHISDIHSHIQSNLVCLKPGGLLIYSVPSANSFLSIVENNILNVPPHHISWWSDKALKKIAELFDLTIIEIKHEELADIHLKCYAYAVSLKRLKSIFGFNSHLVNLDIDIFTKILNKSSALIARIYEKKLKNLCVRPDGHSVIIVYQKHTI